MLDDAVGVAEGGGTQKSEELAPLAELSVRPDRHGVHAEARSKDHVPAPHK